MAKKSPCNVFGAFVVLGTMVVDEFKLRYLGFPIETRAKIKEVVFKKQR